MVLKKFTSTVTGKLAQMRREAEERDAKRNAEKSGFPYLNIGTASVINVEAIGLISEEKARDAKMVVINAERKKLLIVAVDPTSDKVKKIIEELKTKNYETVIYTVSLSGLNYVLDFYKFVAGKQKNITGEVKIKEQSLTDLSKKFVSLAEIRKFLEEIKTDGGQTGQILETVLVSALNNRVSDIHFEPTKGGVKLRLRIDGLLQDVGELARENYNHILSRIKLLSLMKINIHDQTQDGRFSINLSKKTVEVRVAVAPTEYGEVIVMRLLNPDMLFVDLKQLGLREDDLKIIETELKRPNGLILNTGPTGSGKTTTLYAFLNFKKNPELKIITIEDPVEYHLAGIEQTQADDEAGYTFANGLRSIMRQDPDIILVGEIRDKETAEIGIQASLTGHLVFSTVHTNAAAGAIPRLLDLGVRTSSIGPALNLIIAQRLTRRLCPYCKTEQKIDDELKTKIEKMLAALPVRVKKDDFKEIKIFQPKGCDKCNCIGYKGRVAIYELLLVSSEMEELINKESSEVKINKFALEQGMVTMQQDGILKVISGITTFDEVETATGPIEWI